LFDKNLILHKELHITEELLGGQFIIPKDSASGSGELKTTMSLLNSTCILHGVHASFPPVLDGNSQVVEPTTGSKLASCANEQAHVIAQAVSAKQLCKFSLYN
jgi:hypothetical protein